MAHNFGCGLQTPKYVIAANSGNTDKCPSRRYSHALYRPLTIVDVTIYWGAVIGFFLGFAFGVGCALAVMYSIFLGGYRAAIRDVELSTPPERLIKARAKLANSPKAS